MATLYLIPTPLDQNYTKVDLPAAYQNIIMSLRYFIVESNKCAARFLSIIEKNLPKDSLLKEENEQNKGREFFTLNEHTPLDAVVEMLSPLKNGFNMGLLSDAGCPCVGDPGSVVVSMAQDLGYRVAPLIGPNAFIMALMASGFNGQCFSFNGYLPIKDGERQSAIVRLEKLALKGQTQGFIETPYRNGKILKSLVETLHETTKVCVACNITAKDEYIATKTIGGWKKVLDKTAQYIHKKPSIFLIGATHKIIA